jgi:hypothetical protein
MELKLFFGSEQPLLFRVDALSELNPLPMKQGAHDEKLKLTIHHIEALKRVSPECLKAGSAIVIPISHFWDLPVIPKAPSPREKRLFSPREPGCGSIPINPLFREINPGKKALS